MDVIREIYRGDIFYVMPGPAYSAEIGTKGRPAVIVSPPPDRSFCETVNVVYLTTRPQSPGPTHVPVMSSAYPSTAICEQICSVHIDRLGNFFAAISDDEMDAIDRGLLVALGLDRDGGEAEEAKKRPTIEGGGAAYPPAAQLLSQLRAEQQRNAMLQAMYDSLLDRILNRQT